MKAPVACPNGSDPYFGKMPAGRAAMAWLAGAAEERMQRASSDKVQDAPTGEAGPLVCPKLNSARKSTQPEQDQQKGLAG